MGKKYSINSAGNIVAERDIYSLGGFIPKGSIGGKIASEEQLSQDGECWLAGGDFSNQENIRVKDNAFIETPFITAAEKYKDTDVTVEGNSRLYGEIGLHPLISYKSGIVIRDSYVAVEHDLLCTPSVNTAGFPFESGSYDANAPKGTPLSGMKIASAAFCRSIRESQEGKETFVYFPPGMACCVLWLYKDKDGALKYSGETVSLSANYARIYHPVYKYFVFYFYQEGLSIDTLESKGCRLIGRPSSSSRIVFYPISASGMYTLINSKLRVKLNVWTEAVQVYEWLAGYAHNCDIEISKDQNSQIFGTFSNINRLEINRPGSGSSSTNRDTIVQAYDCPLFRLHSDTLSNALSAAGGPTFKNCVVPKGVFGNDTIEGNIYEDIDFSYTQEHLSKSFLDSTLVSSHRQGLYAASNNNRINAFVSRPENAVDGATLGPDAKDTPLDGSIIEQGAYNNTLIGTYYEDTKSDFSNRVRTRVPFSTRDAYLPAMPPGFKIAVACYLDEYFILTYSQVDPTSISSEYPYCVLAFGRSDNSAITPKDFAALNLNIRHYDYSSVPTISGNGLVDRGCTVRGDIEVIGQPYVNRILDVNMWERGTTGAEAPTWNESKGMQVLPHRVRLVDTIRVRPGDTVTCKDAYYVECNAFDENGQFLSRSAWVKSYKVPENASFLGLVLRLVSDGYMDESDIQAAGVRYVTEFKTENYITNELSRTSPGDTLIGPDYWENKLVNNISASDGKPYDTIKLPSDKALILKKPINILNATLTTYIAEGFTRGNYRFDADTKYYYGTSAQVTSALMSLMVQREVAGVLQPSDIADAQLRINYVPTPRIVKPFGSGGIVIQRTRVRLYDNAVLSVQLASGTDVVLKGNAVMGTTPGACVCANGHDDAVIKQP